MKNVLIPAVVFVLVTGCFEDPVSEQIELKIREDNLVDVTLTVRVSERTQRTDTDEPQTLFERRLEEERSRLLSGADEWSQRFARVNPGHETLLFEKNRGLLTRVQRRATLTFAEVESLFSATGVTLRLASDDAGDDATQELSIHAGRNPHVSREDERIVNAALDSWSNAAVTYLRALNALYRYIDENPARARVMFEKVLESAIEAEREPELSEGEAKLASDVDSAIGDLATIFEPGEGETQTLQERSARVYDPFPAALVVHVPGRVLEQQGFGRSGTELLVKPLSLWGAMESLESRFASPDPFVTLLKFHRTEPESREKIDLVRYAAIPRRVNVVTAADVKKALEEKLEPVTYYHARWVRPAGRPTP